MDGSVGFGDGADGSVVGVGDGVMVGGGSVGGPPALCTFGRKTLSPLGSGLRCDIVNLLIGLQHCAGIIAVLSSLISGLAW